jgi:choice-of-anchor A domain-containing protein
LLLIAAVVVAACGDEAGRDMAARGPTATRLAGQELNSEKRVLILGSTVAGGASSREAQAAAAMGHAVDVVTPAEWATMSAQQFMSYAALIIGDAACQAGEEAFAAAINNRNTWGAIIDGNVVIMGANPVSNSTPFLVENAIKVVAGRPFVTGMYVALGCAYKDAPPNTPVPLLEPFGTFEVAGVDCVSSAHIFRMEPSTLSTNLTDTRLVGQGCAARSVFTRYPNRTFAFAAVGTSTEGGIPGEQLFEDYLARKTYLGTPYVLVRGAMAQSAGCGISPVPPGEECDMGDGLNGVPAWPGSPPESTCSFSCKLSWCGDGFVDTLQGEECDNGYLNGRDLDGNISGCTGFCKLPDLQPPPSTPPSAVCRNVTVLAQDTCGVAADVDNGSYDPDGDLVGCTQSPAGPYPIGTTTVTLTCVDAASNSASCHGVVTVEDRVVPTISLMGPSTEYLECGAGYTDPGATAHDLCSGDMTDAIQKTGSVAPGVPGIHVVSYDVTDAAGNSPAAVMREVTVSDSLPPALTLQGPASVMLECGMPYTDPGAAAFDQCAGDLTAFIMTAGSVNHHVPGSYVLTFSVSDPSGLAAPALSRTVTVQDTQAPQLELLPGPSVIECNGAPYVDPGAMASDACAGELTSSITVSSNLDQSREGEYAVTYRVEDGAGNLSTAIRQLTVRGPCAGGCTEIRLSDYNLFLLGDYHGGHDVEGKVAAGGNIAMTDFSVGHMVPNGATARTLVAGGNLTLSRGGVWGEAFYGGSYSADGTVVFPRGHTTSKGMPIDFAARFAELRSLSAQLAARPANGTTSREVWGGIMLRGSDPKLNVFAVNASAFTGAKLLYIEAPAGSLVVVNIHGASATFTGFGHSFAGGINQNGILYNFVDTTSITARGYGFWGTVLAPYAHVDFSDGSFDGGIYAVSFTGNAEGHINVLHDRDLCQ